MQSHKPSKPTKQSTTPTKSTPKPTSQIYTTNKPSTIPNAHTPTTKPPTNPLISTFPDGATPYIFPFENKDHWKLVVSLLTPISGRKNTIESFETCISKMANTVLNFDSPSVEGFSAWYKQASQDV
jgi:hypothetical protein